MVYFFWSRGKALLRNVDCYKSKRCREVSATTQEQAHSATQDEQSIEAWICKVQAGEISWFACVIEEVQQPIYRYCWRLLGNRQDAEDATQDILLKAYQSIRRYKPDTSFRSWLYRIASNHCMNILRRRSLQGRVLRFFNPAAVAMSPEQHLDERLYSYPLNEALQQLSPDERNLLVLRIYEERTYIEIGEILNISPNALHKRMEKIKHKIRKTITAKEAITWDMPNTTNISKL